MNRLFATIWVMAWANFLDAFGQNAYPTLELQQFPNSHMLWLSPKEGRAIAESNFFQQPGITDFLGAHDAMELLESRMGAGEITHRHYQQRHGGYEVEGAIFSTHAQNELLKMANGHLARITHLGQPVITEEDAIYAVLKLMGLLAPMGTEGEDYIQPQASLVYAPIRWETYGYPLEHRLAFRVSIVVTNPYASTISYVDAETGEIFRVEEASMGCAAGSAYTLYHGWQAINGKFYNFLGSHYELRDECRGERIHTRVDNHNNNDSTHFYAHGGCSDLSDGDNLWQSTGQRPAATLHWATEMFYDYLDEKLDRDGIDGAGSVIKVVYHPYELRERTGSYTIFGWQGAIMSPFNAKWDIQLEEAHFGKGDEIAPWVSLDVVSHELAHGVIATGNSQRLMGGNEARTLNESFADIFSVCSEAYALPLHDPSRLPNFTFGEDVANGPIRSMSEPWLYNGPRAYNQSAWPPNNTNEPHQFSSVQSYWFYLLAFGSAGKPVEGNTMVCGIGLDNAAQIAYREITDYLQTGATHQDAQMAAIQAAQDAFGVGSFEAIQCENAWAAVGIGVGSRFCNPVGQDEIKDPNILSFSVWPNPASSRFEVFIDTPTKQSDCTLHLWSATGTKLAEIPVPNTLPPGSHKFAFESANLSSGTYHLHFLSDDTHLWKKVVIVP
jgi:Zn-dependent metalloprotease